MTTEIYLDGNATSAILPAALAAAIDTMAQRFGNPSSTHSSGLQAKVTLDAARQRACRLLGVGEGKLMFNSGATEGIHSAVLSALCALRERRAGGEAVGSLLLYGATEHKAVPEALAHWNRVLGLQLQLQALPVDGDGRHDLAALAGLLDQTALLCTMAANNETGAISDLDGIEALLRARASRAYWLVDCVQALGKLDLNLAASRIDYAPFSGHKLYAPKGVGMLYVRAGAPFTPLLTGGGQEAGLRSGTENMAGIAALGAVLEALEQGGTFRSHAELEGYRSLLADSLGLALPGVVFNNNFALSLPTTLNFSVPGLASGDLMDVFDAAGVRVSSGSACSAKKAAPSYVLDAMGLPLWRSGGAIRMSFGPLVDGATIRTACERIARCGAALRSAGLIADQAPAEALDGVLQLGVDGACSWLLLDAASRSCVVLDPLPETAARIELYVRGQQLRVQAIVSTGAARHGELAAALGWHASGALACDRFGWPAHAGGQTVGLADGSAAECLQLGTQVLARVVRGEQCSYLLGPAGSTLAPSQVRFAFCAHAVGCALGPLIALTTLLCPSRDADNQFCTSLLAGAGAAAAGGECEAGPLAAFLQRHPDAVLVDVREAHEFAASAVTPGGLPVRSVPLSRFVAELEPWLAGQQRPLLLFCRSGNRSIKAVQCLRRLGYAQAWNLGGGLALAPRR